MGVILAPMIVPTIIVAVGMYFVFAPLRLNSTYLGLVLAHTALAVPFVVVTVDATLAGFDVNLMRAAASLGAPPWMVFFRVVLPLILPGIVSGALFAFVVSFDEAVMALFIAGPNQTTLPRQMFSDLRESIDPTIVAVATVLILVSVALMALIEMLRRRVERLRALRRA
jgi:putative spermidine/putrescine transport system permease protein